MPIQSFDGYRRNDDYLRDVARGGVPGARPYRAYGRRTATGPEDSVLWPNGAYYFPPAAGTTVSFVSSSVEDAVGGTGIHALEVHYLDSSLQEQVVDVTLTGTTPVVDAIADVRFIECMHLLPGQFGSNKAAAGNIRAYNGSENYSYVAAGDRRCASSVRMVPAGKRLLIFEIFGGASSGTSAAKVLIELGTSHFDGHDFTADNILIPGSTGSFQDNSAGTRLSCPAAFEEGEAVGMLYTTDKAATITGSWFGVLENE